MITLDLLNYICFVCRPHENPYVYDINISKLPVLTPKEYLDKVEAKDDFPERFIVKYWNNVRNFYIKKKPLLKNFQQ